MYTIVDRMIKTYPLTKPPYNIYYHSKYKLFFIKHKKIF